MLGIISHLLHQVSCIRIIFNLAANTVLVQLGWLKMGGDCDLMDIHRLVVFTPFTPMVAFWHEWKEFPVSCMKLRFWSVRSRLFFSPSNLLFCAGKVINFKSQVLRKYSGYMTFQLYRYSESGLQLSPFVFCSHVWNW